MKKSLIFAVLVLLLVSFVPAEEYNHNTSFHAGTIRNGIIHDKFSSQGTEFKYSKGLWGLGFDFDYYHYFACENKVGAFLKLAYNGIIEDGFINGYRKLTVNGDVPSDFRVTASGATMDVMAGPAWHLDFDICRFSVGGGLHFAMGRMEKNFYYDGLRALFVDRGTKMGFSVCPQLRIFANKRMSIVLNNELSWDFLDVGKELCAGANGIQYSGMEFRAEPISEVNMKWSLGLGHNF